MKHETDPAYPQLGCVKHATRVFYFLCILTGQYVKFPATKAGVAICILVVILLTMHILLNVGAVLFDLYAIKFSNFNQYCGFIYATPLHPKENHTHDSRLIPPDLNHFDDWKKTVITIATFSATLAVTCFHVLHTVGTVHLL